MKFINIATVAAVLLCGSVLAQTSVTTIAPGTFGDKHYKAPVATETALPMTGNSIADQRRVLNTGEEYWWNGFAWVQSQSSGEGSVGPAGPQGIQGEKGDKGDPGDVGPEGPAPSGASNQVFATPDGNSGVAGLRLLVPSDIPVLSDVQIPDTLTLSLNSSSWMALGGNTSGHVGIEILAPYSLIRFRQGDGNGWAIADGGRFRAMSGTLPVATLTASGVELSSPASVSWSSAGDATQTKVAGIALDPAGVVKFTDGDGGGSGSFTVKSFRQVPQVSPPITCGSIQSLGWVYTDDSGADCFCNGTVWVNRSGSGSCS